MARETRSEGTGKAPYSAPALRLYGSVRDLTGDVSGAASDMTFATNATRLKASCRKPFRWTPTVSAGSTTRGSASPATERTRTLLKRALLGG